MKNPINWTHLQPQFSGQWVAFKQDEITVISHAVSFKSAINTAIRRGVKEPIMFKVPQNPVAYVGSV